MSVEISMQMSISPNWHLSSNWKTNYGEDNAKKQKLEKWRKLDLSFHREGGGQNQISICPSTFQVDFRNMYQ